MRNSPDTARLAQVAIGLQEPPQFGVSKSFRFDGNESANRRKDKLEKSGRSARLAFWRRGLIMFRNLLQKKQKAGQRI